MVEGQQDEWDVASERFWSIDPFLTVTYRAIEGRAEVAYDEGVYDVQETNLGTEDVEIARLAVEALIPHAADSRAEERTLRNHTPPRHCRSIPAASRYRFARPMSGNF